MVSDEYPLNPRDNKWNGKKIGDTTTTSISVLLCVSATLHTLHIMHRMNQVLCAPTAPQRSIALRHRWKQKGEHFFLFCYSSARLWCCRCCGCSWVLNFVETCMNVHDIIYHSIQPSTQLHMTHGTLMDNGCEFCHNLLCLHGFWVHSHMRACPPLFYTIHVCSMLVYVRQCVCRPIAKSIQWILTAWNL